MVVSICLAIIYVGISYDFPWISVLSVLIFVFGIGCFYEIINSRARKIHDKLKEFIEKNDDFEDKGIEIRPGPFGAYIEFSVIRAKTL